eukprot:1969715-Amphidinium_carterae.1
MQQQQQQQQENKFDFLTMTLPLQQFEASTDFHTAMTLFSVTDDQKFCSLLLVATETYLRAFLAREGTMTRHQ